MTTIAAGELGALLALNKRADAAGPFKTLISDFGLDVETDWTDDDISDLFDGNHERLYYDSLTEIPRPGSGASATITAARRLELFRGWHWYYRFQSGSRYLPKFQQSMWSMARVRLRELLATPWGKIPDPKRPGKTLPVPQYTDANGTTRAATLGETFRSELSTAMLLRLYVKVPSHIVKHGVTAANPVRVLQALYALKPALATTVTNAWDPATELEIAKNLLACAAASSTLWRDLNGMRSKTYGEPKESPLATTRDFQLDVSGLPLAP